MNKYCTNCGHELNENADVCLKCGYLVKSKGSVVIQNPYYNPAHQNTEGKSLATVSVVFGSLGFYPLLFIGSIVGFITSIIGIYDKNNQFKGRSKIGLGLSIGSFAFWLFIIILIIIEVINMDYYY